MSEVAEIKHITQEQEDKIYTFALERTAEFTDIEDVLAGGCKGYDNMTTAELIEDVVEYLSQEEDLSDLPDDINAIIQEYQANEEIHRTLTEVSNDDT